MQCRSNPVCDLELYCKSSETREESRQCPRSDGHLLFGRSVTAARCSNWDYCVREDYMTVMITGRWCQLQVKPGGTHSYHYAVRINKISQT